jgi:hypothetical protein
VAAADYAIWVEQFGSPAPAGASAEISEFAAGALSTSSVPRRARGAVKPRVMTRSERLDRSAVLAAITEREMSDATRDEIDALDSDGKVRSMLEANRGVLASDGAEDRPARWKSAILSTLWQSTPTRPN